MDKLRSVKTYDYQQADAEMFNSIGDQYLENFNNFVKGFIQGYTITSNLIIQDAKITVDSGFTVKLGTQGIFVINKGTEDVMVGIYKGIRNTYLDPWLEDTLTFDGPDANNRIDIIEMEINYVDDDDYAVSVPILDYTVDPPVLESSNKKIRKVQEVTMYIKKGTPGITPVAPDATIGRMVIREVHVNTGAIQLLAGDIKSQTYKLADSLWTNSTNKANNRLFPKSFLEVFHRTGDVMEGDIDCNSYELQNAFIRGSKLVSSFDCNENFITNPKDPTDATQIGDREFNDIRYSPLGNEGIIKDPDFRNRFWTLQTNIVYSNDGVNGKESLKFIGDGSARGSYYEDPYFGRYLPISSLDSFHFRILLRRFGTPGAGAVFLVRLETYQKDKTTIINTYNQYINNTALDVNFRNYFGTLGFKSNDNDSTAYFTLELRVTPLLTIGSEIWIDKFIGSKVGLFPTYSQLADTPSIFILKPLQVPIVSDTQIGPSGASNWIWFNDVTTITINNVVTNFLIPNSSQHPFQVKGVLYLAYGPQNQTVILYKGNIGTTLMWPGDVFNFIHYWGQSGHTINELAFAPISFFDGGGQAFLRLATSNANPAVAFNIVGIIL